MEFLSSKHLFQPIARPSPVLPDSTLDEDLLKSADDATLVLSMINMVVVKATNLPNLDAKYIDLSDPYCVVTVGEISDRTGTVDDNLSPVWNETMNFFVAKQPETVKVAVWDADEYGKDDLCGKGELSMAPFFAQSGSREVEVPLSRPKDGVLKRKGSVTINISCRTLRPVETEIRLGHARKQLACLGREKDATVAALDESEELRREVLEELSARDRDVLEKAAELEEAVASHGRDLTLKEKALLDLAQDVEAKVQEKEEAEVARREAEAQRQAAETKLTDAEKKILASANLLEEKEKTNAAALTAKEKEVLSIAARLEDKEQASRAAEERLNQVEALKSEVENELTSKEKIIQNQARQIEKRAKETAEALSRKDQEILKQAKALDARAAAADAAQRRQDAAAAERDKIRAEFAAYTEETQRQLEDARKEVARLEEELETRRATAATSMETPLLGVGAEARAGVETEASGKLCPCCTVM